MISTSGVGSGRGAQGLGNRGEDSADARLWQQTRRLLLVGLAFYLVAALFGEGFIHPDEHFQILEFASARLRLSPLADLPWEFQERIRPSLQPVLAMGALWLFRSVGIVSPFVVATALRTCIAVLAWVVSSRAVLFLSRRLVRKQSRALLAFGVMGLWFMPLLSARFSSENLSAILLLSSLLYLGPAADERPCPVSARAFFVAGVLWGLSFFARFQIAFALVGISLWIGFVARPGLFRIALLALGCLSVGLACVALDSWFYGQLTFSPLRYFVANLIEHRAAEWGVEPWWWYIPQAALWTFPLIGLPLVVFALRGAARSRHDPLVFWVVPFLLGHAAIGHKELRFLFPLAIPVVYLAVRGVDSMLQGKSRPVLPRWAVPVAVLGNLILFGLRMLIPLSSEVRLAHSVWDVADLRGPTTVVTVKTPLDEWFGLPMHFYRHPAVHSEVAADLAVLARRLSASTVPTTYVVLSTWDAVPLGPGTSAQVLYCYPPAWTEPFLPGPVKRLITPLRLFEVRGAARAME